MKKLILSLIILFSLTVSGQIQERYVFDNVVVAERGKEVKEYEASNTVYVNYEGKPVVKVLSVNNETIWFDQLVPGGIGITEEGLEYYYGFFRQRDTDFYLTIRVFKDINYGIWFITGNSLLQFY